MKYIHKLCLIFLAGLTITIVLILVSPKPNPESFKVTSRRNRPASSKEMFSPTGCSIARPEDINMNPMDDWQTQLRHYTNPLALPVGANRDMSIPGVNSCASSNTSQQTFSNPYGLMYPFGNQMYGYCE